MALVISIVAMSDVTLAQSGRRSRRPARTPSPAAAPAEPTIEPPAALEAETTAAPSAPSVVDEPPASEPIVDVDAAATSSDDGRPARVKFHAAGASFHATMFASEARYGYSLLGPAVTYTYFVGRRWGFAVRGSIYFPLSGRYAGGEIDERGALRGPYDVRRIGLDGTLMAATRREFGSNLALLVGVGLHVQSYKLVGTNYIAIDGISGGIGGMARLDYRISPTVSVGLDVAAGVDPLDLVRHSNRAVVTATVSSGLSLGLTFD